MFPGAAITLVEKFIFLCVLGGFFGGSYDCIKTKLDYQYIYLNLILILSKIVRIVQNNKYKQHLAYNK